ncbi:MAG: CpaF family protein [Phycisphaerales bacterium]|nr:CpaF family protein [Phycisphaerales bacterium]
MSSTLVTTPEVDPALTSSNPTARLHALFDATISHYLACLQEFLKDTAVSEVMVNRWDEVYIERDGKIVKTPVKFPDQEAYEAAVNNILQFTGKTLTENQMLLDSRLPDGSRVHVAREPCSRHGTVMTIRKFNRQMLDMDWLTELGTLTDQAAGFLRTAVRNERNVLVTGGTSSGKTSLLNALSAYISQRRARGGH